MTTYKAFADDSTDRQAYVVAGYVSTLSQWERFDREWAKVLHRKPRIGYFKMHEARQLQGQFKAFDEKQRDAKVRSFARVANNRALFSVASVIRKADWEHFIDSWLNRQNRSSDRRLNWFVNALKDPYMFSIITIVASCLRGIDENATLGETEFVFDEQGRVGRRALKFWPEIKSSAPAEYREYLVKKPSHEDDKLFKPLQAADLYAWSLRRVIVTKGSTGEIDIAAARVAYVNIWTERQLREWFGMAVTRWKEAGSPASR